METAKTAQGFLQLRFAEGLSLKMVESYSPDLMQWTDYLV
jgi:hypothetical protein